MTPEEPPATLAQMQRTLREVGPRCNPFLRGVLEQIARRQALLRDPGDEG